MLHRLTSYARANNLYQIVALPLLGLLEHASLAPIYGSLAVGIAVTLDLTTHIDVQGVMLAVLEAGLGLGLLQIIRLRLYDAGKNPILGALVSAVSLTVFLITMSVDLYRVGSCGPNDPEFTPLGILEAYCATPRKSQPKLHERIVFYCLDSLPPNWRRELYFRLHNTTNRITQSNRYNDGWPNATAGFQQYFTLQNSWLNPHLCQLDSYLLHCPAFSIAERQHSQRHIWLRLAVERRTRRRCQAVAR